ncbi:MAG: cardiolipin synthase [Salinivirgaceae bacterium]|nr:cardiolipin synthase [Salinivirgaceae bacterium]
MEFLSEIWTHLYLGFYGIYSLLVAFIVIFVITDDKNPAKTLAWVMILIFLPIVGIMFYLFFGQNYRKQKIFSRKGLQDFRQIEQLSFEQLEYLEQPEMVKYRAAFKKLHIIKLLLNNSKSIVSRHNEIIIISSGREKFNLMVRELKKAKHHIHMEYYIFESDDIGNKIIDILIEKSRQNIEVRLIIDHVGSWHFKKKRMKELKAAGVDVQIFMPVTFPYFTSKINFRNHRKIVVIDGKTGFVGGMNIADKYIYGTKKLGSWRDIHLQITGEAVHSLQTVFLTDWYFLTHQLPTDNIYFPASQTKKHAITQVVASGPDSSWAGIMQTYFSAIATARNSLYIITPYLLPNSAILTALKTVSLSGVDVKIIIPRKSDSRIVYYASLSYIKELMDAGIKMYFYNNGFIHSKVMVVDGLLSSVGTANLDYRSFSLNFEVNALIYDKNTAADITKIFNYDLTDSSLISASEWAKRKWHKKLRSSIARLFSPLL